LGVLVFQARVKKSFMEKVKIREKILKAKDLRDFNFEILGFTLILSISLFLNDNFLFPI